MLPMKLALAVFSLQFYQPRPDGLHLARILLGLGVQEFVRQFVSLDNEEWGRKQIGDQLLSLIDFFIQRATDLHSAHQPIVDC